MPKFESTIPATGIRIRKKGQFPLNNLYSEIKSWLKEYEYEFQEKENSIKAKQKGTEVKIKFEAFRDIDEYARFELNINLLGENVKKTGNINTGNIEVRIYANLNLDYKKRWQSTAFGEFLYKIYNNFIIINKIRNHYLANLTSEVKSLQDLIKDILNLENE